MSEADPLEDVDIYANERPKKEENAAPAVDPEETEMESDLGDLLKKSFVNAKDKSTYVQNVPELIQKKKDDTYANLFKGITVNDLDNLA